MEFFEKIQFKVLFLIERIHNIYVSVKRFYIAKKNSVKNKINNVKTIIKNKISRLFQILNLDNSNISDFVLNFTIKIYNEMQEIDYSTSYSNLIKNLDEKSVKCVDNIISKIKLVAKDKIFKNGFL